MIKKNTWIVLGVFAIVLVAAVSWQFGFKNNIQPTAIPTTIGAQVMPLFPDVTGNMVAGVTIQSTDGSLVTLVRDSGGLWLVQQPTEGTTDPTAAETLVTEITSLYATPIVNPLDDFGVYGLTQPAYVIELLLNGGVTHVIHVGDIAPMSGEYYIQVDGGEPMTVNQMSMSTILGAITNPPFQTTPTIDVTMTPTTGSLQSEATSTPTP